MDTKNFETQKQPVDISLRMENIYFHFVIIPPFSEISENTKQHKIILTLSGTVHVLAENQTFLLNKGDMFFIPPTKKYFIHSLDVNNFICIEIEYKYIDTEINEDLYTTYAECLSITRCMHIKNIPDGELLARAILYDLSEETPGILYRLKTHLSCLLFLLIDTLFLLKQETFIKNKTSVKTNYPDMRNLFIDTYLNENYKEDISLKLLSDKVSLSTKQVNRIIKKMYGRSFYQQITFLRITEAKKHLQFTNMPIEEIAYQIGYTTHTGFYKAFKHITGLTPSEFRIRNKKQ